MSGLRTAGAVLGLAVGAWAAATGALAQSGADIENAHTQLRALRAEHERLGAAILAVEQQLAREAPAAEDPAETAARANAPPARLQFSGDFRTRYELNTGADAARDRGRAAIRGRLRAHYALTDAVMLGAELGTGDPDDPNSNDVTLSEFDDDLRISLNQTYARIGAGEATLWLGRFPQPFTRTDLVWDGDVNPQGLAASYKARIGPESSLRVTAMDFIIDESAAGADSAMLGAQAEFAFPLTQKLRLSLAAGYYDYELDALAGADSGDFRSNLLGSDGRFLSDFNLADAVISLSYTGFGEQAPLLIVGDYVRNLGAFNDADTGYALDIFLGRARDAGDWRLGYGYAAADVDAVLAAFSHDNTDLATNYMQHALSLDYMLSKHVLMNGTIYVYRPKDALYAGERDPDDWLERLRLNAVFSF